MSDSRGNCVRTRLTIIRTVRHSKRNIITISSGSFADTSSPETLFFVFRTTRRVDVSPFYVFREKGSDRVPKMVKTSERIFLEAQVRRAVSQSAFNFSLKMAKKLVTYDPVEIKIVLILVTLNVVIDRGKTVKKLFLSFTGSLTLALGNSFDS